MTDHSAADHDTQLSVVLPIALAGTGRPGSDLERAALLFESVRRCVDFDEIAVFLVVTRAQDVPALATLIAAHGLQNNLTLVDECAICPELAADPDTSHGFPVVNRGWFRQQLIKLAAADHVPGGFYLTLDSDVVFVRRFRAADLFAGGRAIVNVQTMSDFLDLYTVKMAEESQRIRLDRDRRAEELLGLTRCHDWFYGETPVLLSTTIVKSLLAHIERTHQSGWCGWLIDSRPWTEYTLYFTFAEGRGLLDRYHAPGGFNSILRMSDSLWYEADAYAVPRSIDNWRPTPSRHPDEICVVVQSYLGYAPSEVRTKVLGLLDGVSS